jgi:hypothetical protein
MVRRTPEGAFDLVKTFRETYFALRFLLSFVAATLPLWLVVGEFICEGKFGVRKSISAYYDGPMRDWFVGALIAVGAGLYIYKGLSERENGLLNVAGVLAVLTALFPHYYVPGWWPISKDINPHGISAVSFFVAIALVCWFCKNDSLDLGLIPKEEIAAYKRRYNAIGVGLVALAVSAAAGVMLLSKDSRSSLVFWLETVALGLFSYYWFTKSGELGKAVEDRRGAPGPMATPSPSPETHT